ncbi:MAG: hypothetical protein COV30_00080 [Candidatus Yanofskybacteria bacterium CG10_big_fil_rev_8_21_14_0_10_37_15]|uniref:Uncharacterized protein n=1 Tax=Candidatus Yanofskybacteria bacterium CG10_big_fil_rev_8_21_14_0_10_37_15 TaxID=1975097 RepID=A0A2H0R6E5_9BACT|nr:MAG: hypothetical protein COV30_00080 [Candidatus Yanofskybacteria bacterium CG10_big_fil_rev_8_21_14_0_10_37_15]
MPSGMIFGGNNHPTIAKLDPKKIKLIVFRILIKSHLIPDFVPVVPARIDTDSFISIIPGEKILESVEEAWFGPLFISLRKKYFLIGAKIAEIRDDKRSDLRFTFCHKDNLKSESHPNFEKFRNKLNNFMIKTLALNLWSTEVFMNPYFLKEENGNYSTKSSVLLFNCHGRRPCLDSDGNQIEVYEKKGKDEFGKGIGPKVPITSISSFFDIDSNNNLKIFYPFPPDEEENEKEILN